MDKNYSGFERLECKIAVFVHKLYVIYAIKTVYSLLIAYLDL